MQLWSEESIKLVEKPGNCCLFSMISPECRGGLLLSVS